MLKSQDTLIQEMARNLQEKIEKLQEKKGYYRKEQIFYKINRKCYRKGKLHQNGKKKVSKNSKILNHNLTLDPTKNLLREG